MAAAGGSWTKISSGPHAGTLVFVPQGGNLGEALAKKLGLPVAKPAPAPAAPKSYKEFPATSQAGPIHLAMQPEYKAWANGLTPSEQEALKRYTGYYEGHTGISQKDRLYYRLNQALRDGTYNDSSTQPKMAQTKQGLDSALGKSKIPFDLVTFRGYVQEALYKAVTGGKLQPGTELVDKAFASTSQRRATATHFTKGTQYPVLLRISASKGAPGAYVSWNQINPKFMHESELLLPRNARFVVTGSSVQLMNGKKVAVVEVSYDGIAN